VTQSCYLESGSRDTYEISKIFRFFMRKAVQQKMEFKSSYEQLSCLDWKFLPNWDFSNTYIPNRNRSQKGRINEQNIQPDMLNDLSANKSDDRKPDYLRMFMEAFFEGDCKNGCFLNSTNTTYYLPSLSFFVI